MKRTTIARLSLAYVLMAFFRVLNLRHEKFTKIIEYAVGPSSQSPSPLRAEFEQTFLMRSLELQPVSWLTRLLMAGLLSFGLAACNGRSSSALLEQAKAIRALSFAEQTLKLKPGNPAVMDTLGWILVQQGQTERGIKLLQQALSKVPDGAEIHWHLAYGLYLTGDTMRARQELKTLMGHELAFPAQAQAQHLYHQLFPC